MRPMDTFRVAERLTADGAFTQAKALVEALRETEREDLVTKADLAAALTAVKDELRAEIANTKAELRAEIANIKAELLKWMFSAMVVQVFAIVGLVRLLFVG